MLSATATQTLPVYNDERTFGTRLAAARKVRGLTQTDLAALLGVSMARYHAWERDNATPNNIALYRDLCLQLNVTVDWLFFGDPKGLSMDSYSRIKHFIG